MAQYALNPKDWVVFREYPERISGRNGYEFIWRIGRVAASPNGEYADIFLCAPEAPREMKTPDPEREPWNTAWIALPKFSPEYFICVHLRNRRNIPWLAESKPRRVLRKDIVLANNVADAEAAITSK